MGPWGRRRGALDYYEIRERNFPDQQTGTYTLELEDAVEFDLEVAEWAMIPRRPLQEPYGSAVDWRGTGVWEDGEWMLEM